MPAVVVSVGCWCGVVVVEWLAEWDAEWLAELDADWLAELDADWLAELDADWLTELDAEAEADVDVVLEVAVDDGLVAEADPLLVLAVGAGVALSLSTVKVARRLEVLPFRHVKTTLIVCDPSTSFVVSYGRALPLLAVPARSNGRTPSVRAGALSCRQSSR